jgi:hypothetical protein
MDRLVEGRPENMGHTTEGELVLVVSRELGLRARPDGLASATGADVGPLAEILESEGIALSPLFGMREEQMQDRAAAMAPAEGTEVPDLSIYYRVEAPAARLAELAARLAELEGVDGAYVKPPTEPADARINEMASSLDEPPMTTPNFSARQRYLDAAPVGIDARHAWTVPGGGGAGCEIIDLEWGWRFTHEDLLVNTRGVRSGTNSTNLDNENHGTAVIGVTSGDRNTLGITGICPDAREGAVSLVTHETGRAIVIAADLLRPGDIILLEVHRAGPRFTPGDWTRFGYIGIEWWPADFDAIRYAISRGIIVVEAAGNGGQNLDDPVYDTRPVGHPRLGTFPATWRNPFNPANPSSGAVLVGAGMPPAGTHGRTAQPDWGDVYADRGRCFFSNWGARIDAQGWGWEVTSTGYGDLQGGTDRNKWYTDQFSGTSSASPVVVGALASVQGVLRAHGRIPLSPVRARELLRTTGSPQQDGPAFTFLPNMGGTGYPQNHPARPRTQRIGNRPNLRQLIARALDTGSWVGVQFTGTIPAHTTHRWFTFRWPAHWHVIWTVMPTSVRAGGPQVEWTVAVERASDEFITYWISIKNLTPVPVSIEARYAVLGW